jgi:hypothetical protein
MQALSELLGTWREDAERLRLYGDSRGADVVQRLAGQLEAAMTDAEREVLSLAAAAEESGYSERRLREFLADGTVPNAGEKGRPRILRGDLPRKGRRSSVDGPRIAYDPAADARAILGRSQRRESL